MTLIKFTNVTFGYKNTHQPIFKDLSFSITKPDDKGHIVGIMGDSGSGKTTLLKLLLKVETPSKGTFELSTMNPVLSYVPQEPVLFEHLSPTENAKYFSLTHRFESTFDDGLFTELANTLGMDKVLEDTTKSINEMSGGEKQRLALLRAMSIKPDIVLLDEPLTGLDEKKKDLFLTSLVRFAHQKKILIIYVTHYLSEIRSIADEIIYLMKDELSSSIQGIHQSSVEDFIKSPPTISALYLVKGNNTHVCHLNKEEARRMLNVAFDSEIDISFESDAIQFSDDHGLEYEVFATNDNYTFIRLSNNESTVTVPSQTYNTYKSKQYIKLTGNVMVYKMGKFDSVINV